MNKSRLEHCKKVCMAATAGSWRRHGNVVMMPGPDYEDEWIGLRGVIGRDGTDATTPGGFTRSLITRDARFIEEARPGWPEALTEIERLYAVLDRIWELPIAHKDAGLRDILMADKTAREVPE